MPSEHHWPYVDAPAARVGDMLPPTDDWPWAIEPTPMPMEEAVYRRDRPADTVVGWHDDTKERNGEIPHGRQLRGDAAQERIRDWHGVPVAMPSSGVIGIRAYWYRRAQGAVSHQEAVEDRDGTGWRHHTDDQGNDFRRRGASTPSTCIRPAAARTSITVLHLERDPSRKSS